MCSSDLHIGKTESENAARRRWTVALPEKKTTRQVRKAKSPSAQAGEYVREEVEHVREGKHGARSAKQVIAIGLSKARRAGAKLPPPAGEEGAARDRSQAESRAIAGGAGLRERYILGIGAWALLDLRQPFSTEIQGSLTNANNSHQGAYRSGNHHRRRFWR